MTLTLLKNVRDVEEDSVRGVSETYLATSAAPGELSLLPALPVVKPALIDISPAGKVFTAVNGKDSAVLELSAPAGVIKVDVAKLHGKVLGDSWFGGVSWSSDEEYVAYVARALPPESTSGSSSAGPSKFEYAEDWGERFDGLAALLLCVLHTGTGRVLTFSHSKAESGDSGTVGCPVFQPRTFQLAYTRWRSTPRRLGAFSCHQRPCTVTLVDLAPFLATSSVSSPSPPSPTDLGSAAVQAQTRPLTLSAGLHVGRQVRFTSDGRTAVLLGRRAAAASHHACYELYKIALSACAEEPPCLELLVPAVEVPAGRHSFPGLFVDSLAPRCFLSPQLLALQSQWGSSDAVLLLDLLSGELSRVELPPTGGEPSAAANLAVTSLAEGTPESSPALWQSPSLGLLEAVAGDSSSAWLTLTAASPVDSPRVLLAQLAVSKSGAQVRGIWSPAAEVWRRPHTVSTKQQVPLSAAGLSVPMDTAHVRMLLADMRWHVFELRAPATASDPGDADDPSRRFEAILLLPPDRTQPLPLLVVPHGGPHSATPTQYLAPYAWLAARLGAAVLHVNYRGSAGLGQRSIDQLLGHIGERDVADVLQALEAASSAAAAQGAQLDPQRRAVIGGSHGGFLAAHLTGQRPQLFRAAVLRNPVTNIPGMTAFTDIPDWCYVEPLGPAAYDFETCATPAPAALAEMHRRSPVAHVGQVQAPTLLCLGGRDRRVPHGQGLEWYHLLRARGVLARLLLFPEDNHSIDKPASELEQWTVTADWIEQFL